MKSCRIVLICSLIGLGTLIAQDTPDHPASNNEGKAVPTASPKSDVVTLSQEKALKVEEKTSGEAPADSEKAKLTPSAKTDQSVKTESTAEESVDKAPTETHSEVAPESTLADLPISDSNALLPDTSIAEGPDEPVSAPDTSFAEPGTGLDFGNSDDSTAPPDIATLPEPAKNHAEEERLQKLKYQKARTQALKDKVVVRALEQAEKAKTLEDYRANYRLYYKQLYKKIAEIDPSLKAYCQLMEDAHIRRLAQSQILPTIPNNPPPR